MSWRSNTGARRLIRNHWLVKSHFHKLSPNEFMYVKCLEQCQAYIRSHNKVLSRAGVVSSSHHLTICQLIKIRITIFLLKCLIMNLLVTNVSQHKNKIWASTSKIRQKEITNHCWKSGWCVVLVTQRVHFQKTSHSLAIRLCVMV